MLWLPWATHRKVWHKMEVWTATRAGWPSKLPFCAILFYASPRATKACETRLLHHDDESQERGKGRTTPLPRPWCNQQAFFACATFTLITAAAKISQWAGFGSPSWTSLPVTIHSSNTTRQLAAPQSLHKRHASVALCIWQDQLRQVHERLLVKWWICQRLIQVLTRLF